MVKGWQETDAGTYYFDLMYGTMAKGFATADHKEYFFNTVTGVKEQDLGEVPEKGWKSVDGKDYWYEDYQRQGYSVNASYRGKEIYDPATDAWYWLDNVQNGAKAVSKDVYQESEAGEWGDKEAANGKLYGKWVRYDAEGHMIKGWDEKDGNKYYFDLTYGTMAKGYATIDGKMYYFNEATGVCEGEYTATQGISWKTKENTTYNADGTMESYYVYEYDEKGNRTSYTGYLGKHYVYDKDKKYSYYYGESIDDMNMTTRYEYDEKGNYKKSERWNYSSNYNNGSYQTYLYSYQVDNYKDGILVDETYWNYTQDGKETDKIVYECNADGNIVKAYCYVKENGAGEFALESTSTCEYVNGYLVKEVRDYVSTERKDTETNYVYNEDGYLTQMSYKVGDVMMSTTTYKYNDKGYLRSRETYDEEQEFVESRTEYTVNDDGNVTEEVNYDRYSSSGELKRTSKTTTEYKDGYETVSYDYSYDYDGTEYCRGMSEYTYENINNKNYKKSYDSYYGHYTVNKDGSVSFDYKTGEEWAYRYGYAYERNKETGRQVKYTNFTRGEDYKKAVNYYRVYADYSFESVNEVGKEYVIDPYYTTYNADGTVRNRYVYKYVSMPSIIYNYQ